MKPSVAIKNMNFAKFPKEVAEKIKSDLTQISKEALDLQKDQPTFKKWIEKMAEMYPAVFGIVEEKKVEQKPVETKDDKSTEVDDLSYLEVKIKELETRLKVIKKMILKQPKKRDELKVRMKVVTKMIDKLKSQLKEAKASNKTKKKLPKKGLGGFLIGALGGFIAGQMVDLQLTRKKIRFELGGTMVGDKKYKYSIIYEIITPESAKIGDYEYTDYIIQESTDELQDILLLAVNRYGIYSPNSYINKDGNIYVNAGCSWSSITPEYNRDYFEKGVEKYYTLIITNVDGSELNQEESQFITDKLGEGRNLHWDEEEKKWWRDGGEVHSSEKDGKLIFKADTKGGKYSIEVRESENSKGKSYSTYEYTNGSLSGIGGNSNKELLIHNLLDTIIGSKKIYGINYFISFDDLGVKDYLFASEKIYDIYNSKEIRDWYVALPQEKKDEITNYAKERAIKYVKDNDYKYDDSTIGSFFNIFRKEKMVKDFYESQGKVLLENGGSFGNENAQMVLNQNNQIKHHAEELGKIVDENTHVPAWAVTKVSDAANDLSDVTHYLDGEKNKMSKGGGVGRNYEIEIIENSKEKRRWKGVVSPSIFNKIKSLENSGGFKRYDVDLYDDSSSVKSDNTGLYEFMKSIGIQWTSTLPRADKNRIERTNWKNGGIISDTPKVYIADLAAYNEGKLVGEWIDLSDFSSGSDVMNKINELLEKWSEEQKEKREEYAVHDMENFPKELYDESMGEEDFQKVIDYWEAVSNSDYPKEVIEEYMNLKGEDDFVDAVNSMDKSYHGKYSSKADFAEQLISDIGMPSNPSSYAYVTETDRRIIAGEEADYEIENMSDYEIIKIADMEDDLEEYENKKKEIEDLEEEIYSLDKEKDADEIEQKENQLEELKSELADMDDADEILKKAKEEVHDEIYAEWYDGLEDPYDFLVKEKGLYDDESFIKQSFINFDYEKFGEELEQDYTMIEHDGDVYVFSDNYKKGGKVSSKKGYILAKDDGRRKVKFARRGYAEVSV